MTSKQKFIFGLTLVLAAAAFALFIPPNAAASKDAAMVRMFEPDEAAPLPYALKMIAPADTLKQAVWGYLFYGFYFYGFPYFFASSLALLPLQWAGVIDQVPLVMLALRQMVSVLPMLLGLLGLVGMQDGFRTYRSPVLFVFLASVPAVLANNFWWHPDGLLFLLVVGVIYCLRRDNLRFGRWFFLAAVVCGAATATKLMGLYFFLAVGLVLALGLLLKKAPLKKLALAAAVFIGLMAASFVISNPFLVSGWARIEYMNTLRVQTEWLSEGYGVVYEKGLAAAWPTMQPNYGEALFLLAALGVLAWAAFRSKDRLLHGLILAWFIPVTVGLLWLTHFKFQYWLPAALPMFSSLAVLLPEKINLRVQWAKLTPQLPRIALILLVIVQFGLFLNADGARYITRLNRAENNVRIAFYDRAVETLTPIPTTRAVKVYFDTRLYVPDTPGWVSESTTDLLEYTYAQQFDVLLLMEQRIRDYLNPEVTGIDPATFALNQQFYRDADQGKLRGYRLVFRNDVGLIFVSDALAQEYFK